MDIKEFLREGDVIVDLSASTKEEVITELVSYLNREGALGDNDEIISLLWEREKIGSTGIGRRVAFPHAKCPSLKELKSVLAISKEGVDFDSLDGQPVYVFFLLLVPADTSILGVGAHIKALSMMTSLLSQDGFIMEITSMSDSSLVYQAISDECSKK